MCAKGYYQVILHVFQDSRSCVLTAVANMLLLSLGVTFILSLNYYCSVIRSMLLNATIQFVCLSVCVIVCLYIVLTATFTSSKPKVVLHDILKIYNVWLLLKTICTKVFASLLTTTAFTLPDKLSTDIRNSSWFPSG